MCKFYNTIEIENLPHSNPFSEPSPHYPIHVLSPRSTQSSISVSDLDLPTPVKRFPSLHGDLRLLDPNVAAILDDISMCTCHLRQLSRHSDALFLDASPDDLCDACLKAAETPLLIPRKLHRQKRVDSLPESMAESENVSVSSLSSSSTLGQNHLSDEDEFSYLTKSISGGFRRINKQKRFSKHVAFMLGDRTSVQDDKLEQGYSTEPERRPNRLQKRRRPV